MPIRLPTRLPSVQAHRPELDRLWDQALARGIASAPPPEKIEVPLSEGEAKTLLSMPAWKKIEDNLLGRCLRQLLAIRDAVALASGEHRMDALVRAQELHARYVECQNLITMIYEAAGEKRALRFDVELSIPLDRETEPASETG